MNRKTTTITTQQYKNIISLLLEGFCEHRPNERVALVLMLEASLGMQIGDVLSLRPCDFDFASDKLRYTGKKGKTKEYRLPKILKLCVENFSFRNNIEQSELLFPITERQVRKQLRFACAHLGYDDVSTLSFKRWHKAENTGVEEWNMLLVEMLCRTPSKTVQP